MNDIVYFVKNASQNEELRFSLRSVDANFPHRKVWIYGGKPADIVPDEFVSVRQIGTTKWEKVRNMLKSVCENEKITEDFWLFNDDFFINQKPTDFKPIYDGSIYKRIVQIEGRNYDKPSQYTMQLRLMLKELERRCPYAPMNNYAVHFPMLVNREKMLTVLNRFQSPMFRVLYGNYWNIGGVDMKDMKILRNNNIPEDAVYLSSDDNSFMTGEIGRYIRKKFNGKSRFEK